MPLPSNIHDLCQTSISLIREEKFSELAEKWKTIDVGTLNEEDAKQLAEYLDSKSELPDIALTAYEALLISEDLVTEKSMSKTEKLFALGGVVTRLLPFTKKYGIMDKAKVSGAPSQQASKSSANTQGSHEEQKSPSASVDSSIPPASTAAPSPLSTMTATDSPLTPARPLSPSSTSRPLLVDVFTPVTTHSATKQQDHFPTRRLTRDKR